MMTSGAWADKGRLMDATCRLALAALLHDLGKITERGAVFDLKSGDGQKNVHLYCPFRQQGGYHSHHHAAATALSLDVIEGLLPPVLHGDVAPFAARGSADETTDSFLNAAAAHHKPSSFLQWCVASGDRVASGFERDDFETYNSQRGQHVVEQMLVPFETYDNPDANVQDALKWRYKLAPLSVSALFPEKLQRQADRPEAVDAYKALWVQLQKGLKDINPAHRQNWPLWLDAMDTLWLTVAHSVPSSSSFGNKADVSLYDHSRSVTAFAIAIWRYHHERGDDTDAVAKAQSGRTDWDDRKILLIQGDFTGIQNFIFGGSASTQKGAAKLLRGRSALVSLLTELAALKVLDALALPSTSQIINAAGKFFIVAPNTPECIARLKAAQEELDAWFLRETFGLAGIVLTQETASCNDFIGAGFANLRQKLAFGLDRAKRQRFNLMGSAAPEPLLETDFTKGVCPFDGRLPADCNVDGVLCARLSADQIQLGGWLAREQRPLLHVERNMEPSHGKNALQSDFFGYRIVLSHPNENAETLRIFDLSLPGSDPAAVLFSGFARRAINAYVPVLKQEMTADKRYDGAEVVKVGDLKTFDVLARDAQQIDPSGQIIGVAALGVLKGDVDNLGQIFANSFQERPTFANWAELSRRVAAFFSLVVPQICAGSPEFSDIYTVFAGGDDFYFFGPWRHIKSFSAHLRKRFAAYCADNDKLHFSAAYLMIKPGHPLQAVSEMIEAGLEHAKAYHENGRPFKNAIHLGAKGNSATLPWHRFMKMEASRNELGVLVEKYNLTTGYLYAVLHYCDMADAAKTIVTEARWRALLYYRTRRHIEQKVRLDAGGNREAQESLVTAIGGKGIDVFCGDYRHVVSDFLYARRD